MEQREAALEQECRRPVRKTVESDGLQRLEGDHHQRTAEIRMAEEFGERDFFYRGIVGAGIGGGGSAGIVARAEPGIPRGLLRRERLREMFFVEIDEGLGF